MCVCVFMQYVEKLDLSGFVSLIDDCSRDRNLEAARMNLRMKDGEIKLTVCSQEVKCSKFYILIFGCTYKTDIELHYVVLVFLVVHVFHSIYF